MMGSCYDKVSAQSNKETDMARKFDAATEPSKKSWRDRTPREESLNDAKMNLRVARSIRQERQELGDRRDNGDANVLADAARLRRSAQSR
jgi:hypothetical protein